MPVESSKPTPETDDAPTVKFVEDALAETQTSPAVADSASPGQSEGQSGTAITCPVCGLVNLPGSVTCSRCLTNWSTTEITAQLDVKLAVNQLALHSAQTPASAPSTGLILELGKIRLPVAVEGSVIVGRNSQVSDGQARSDVDLTSLGAALHGVSRRHVKFTRENSLIYVTDLGSTNGTLLNGQPILPYARRTLQNGDELQLGQLKLKVVLTDNTLPPRR